MLVGFKLSIMIFTLQGDRIKRYFFSELQDEWREVFLVDTIGKLSFFISGFIMRFHTGTEIIGTWLVKYFCCILIWSNLALFNTRYNQVLSDSPGRDILYRSDCWKSAAAWSPAGRHWLTPVPRPLSQSLTPHYSTSRHSSLVYTFFLLKSSSPKKYVYWDLYKRFRHLSAFSKGGQPPYYKCKYSDSVSLDQFPFWIQ